MSRLHLPALIRSVLHVEHPEGPAIRVDSDAIAPLLLLLAQAVGHLELLTLSGQFCRLALLQLRGHCGQGARQLLLFPDLPLQPSPPLIHQHEGRRSFKIPLQASDQMRPGRRFPSLGTHIHILRPHPRQAQGQKTDGHQEGGHRNTHASNFGQMAQPVRSSPPNASQSPVLSIVIAWADERQSGPKKSQALC